MAELREGCVKPARGPILPVSQPASQPAETTDQKEVPMVRVGKEAIDFEANAFVAGEGFKPVRLSEYKGKWIVLCFYPGDFTFV